MDNLENECPGTANAAEAEKKEVAADLGKFKDVKALLDAYNSLEAEFTRRSQRLRELESNKAENPPAQAASGEPSAHTQNSASLYEAAAGGTTLFVTTHYMDEAEYCSRVSIMVDGRIRALDTPARLKQQFAARSMDEVFRLLARGAQRSE